MWMLGKISELEEMGSGSGPLWCCCSHRDALEGSSLHRVA